MKKTTYGVLLLALMGMTFASCEKESLGQNAEAKNEVTQNSGKALTFNYALGAQSTTFELLRKKYDFNTGVFTSGTTFNNHLYYGVAAYDDDLAALEKVGTTECWVMYESGSSASVAGPIKYLGADIIMDEIELLDDDINKLFALRGSRIYKLTYNAGVFDATLLYTYPTTPTAPRRFTIAPLATGNSFIRLYTALSVASQYPNPPAMTTLTYVDLDTASQLITAPTSVVTQIPGMGNLSSFTAKDYFNVPPMTSKYYVVVDKDIYDLSTPTSLALVSSFTASVRDCSFYHY